MKIVGVIRDMKQYGLDSGDSPQVFVPSAQMPVNFMTIVVRTSGNPSALAHPVAGVIYGLDKNLPVSHLVPLTEYMETAVAPRWFATSLSGAFAGLALLLAVVGIYGTVAYGVARRTHEFGIRMAIGATRTVTLTLVLRQGLKLAFIGIVSGVIAALGLTRFLSSLLYGVTPTDPLAFVGVSLILMCVAVAACYVPAHRAMRIDPIIALRYE